MKKIMIIFLVSLCLFTTGCSNGFAKNEYDSNEKISKMEDRYSKEKSVFNPIDGGYSLTAYKFDGRETLWKDKVEEPKDVEISFSFSISKGQAKIVHIDDDGTVITVIEFLPDTLEDGFVTKTVSLSSGYNRLKIVGYDCEDLELKMIFKDTGTM